MRCTAPAGLKNTRAVTAFGPALPLQWIRAVAPFACSAAWAAPRSNGLAALGCAAAIAVAAGAVPPRMGRGDLGAGAGAGASRGPGDGCRSPAPLVPFASPAGAGERASPPRPGLTTVGCAGTGRRCTSRTSLCARPA